MTRNTAEDVPLKTVPAVDFWSVFKEAAKPINFQVSRVTVGAELRKLTEVEPKYNESVFEDLVTINLYPAWVPCENLKSKEMC